MSLVTLLVGLVAGAAAGWWLARRPREPGTAPGVSPHLLPDPALQWLRRCHQALGVWITEMDSSEGAPHAERIVDPDRLSVAQIVAVDRRVERARDQEQHGVERMDSGTLIFQAGGGVAVAILLPPGHEPARLPAVEADLERLMEGVRRRPHIVQLAQARTQEASLESASSVGLRLAYQLERLLGGQVVVAAFENALDATAANDETAPRVRVIGVSGRGDRRLLDTLLPAESELARAATGSMDQAVIQGDPLGSVVADRRHRPATVLLLPIRAGERAVGGVALWLSGGQEPIGAVRTELMEALANAGPRVVTALEADRIRGQTEIDPLTGLQNRKGLDATLARAAAARGQGALVYADLDRFKVLNDTLGHPAGDAALVHFARILREQIRGGDIAARAGGEEFAVWLPDTGLDTGARIAERIRIKLGTTPWAWQGRSWPLSASFGVAACPDTSPTLDALYAQADAALYVAKRSGRNRVERAGGQRGGRASAP
ncbi:MAG TPA: GGDEF domain-containing protein [Gemmatimonadales bacterium]